MLESEWMEIHAHLHISADWIIHVICRFWHVSTMSFITSQVVPKFRESTAWISNFNLLLWVNGIKFQQPKLYLAHVTSCDLNSFRISESHFMGINPPPGKAGFNLLKKQGLDELRHSPFPVPLKPTTKLPCVSHWVQPYQVLCRFPSCGGGGHTSIQRFKPIKLGASLSQNVFFQRRHGLWKLLPCVVPGPSAQCRAPKRATKSVKGPIGGWRGNFDGQNVSKFC